MLRQNDGFFLKPKLISFSTLVFRHSLILLLMTLSCEGQTQGVGPSQTVVTFVGEDVILPCHLDPALDAVSKSVEWGRLDLKPRFVHVWHEGQNLLDDQNAAFRGRTSLFIDKLKLGDFSLKLSAVKLSDNGIYRCYFPAGENISTVELMVGSVSSPVIAGININSSVMVLQCESKGWYPEPEMLWLDSEGNLLSAGPTETVRGPDDLYTVSSRVAVERRNGTSFTCRVKQKNINQIRETEIQISADSCGPTPSLAVRVSIVVIIALIFIVAAVVVLWKWGQNQIKDRKMQREAEAEEREQEQLLAERKKMEDLEEKRAKLEERLQAKEEEEKDLEQAVQLLTEQSKELKKQADQIERLKEGIDRNMEDMNREINSVTSKEDRDKTLSKEYTEMKEITVVARNQLRDRRQEAEQLHLETQTLVTKIQTVLSRMTDRKKEAENQREKINEQLKEIQRKLQSEQKQET